MFCQVQCNKIYPELILALYINYRNKTYIKMSAKKKSGSKKKTDKMLNMRSRGRAEDALLQLVAKVYFV